jgi:hypothetical protein
MSFRKAAIGGGPKCQTMLIFSHNVTDQTYIKRNEFRINTFRSSNVNNKIIRSIKHRTLSEAGREIIHPFKNRIFITAFTRAYPKADESIPTASAV